MEKSKVVLFRIQFIFVLYVGLFNPDGIRLFSFAFELRKYFSMLFFSDVAKGDFCEIRFTNQEKLVIHK